MKVSPAFSKAAGCRGGAPGRAPLKRGTPLCFIKRRRGSKGEPSPGVPPFILGLYVCAVTLGGGRCPVLPFDPISLVLAQRNGVEPPKKSAFLPWRLHHPRERCRSVDYTLLARLGAGRVRLFWRGARMKVSPAFSKAAGCRGGALARAPQSAEPPCALISAGGGLRGNPRRGFPLFFWVCTCAPVLWEVVVALSCDSTPFLWCLPKETVSSRQRKALFYLGGSTIRVSATSR